MRWAGMGPFMQIFRSRVRSLSKLELIDHTGGLIEADADRNNDLFWACRGAGEAISRCRFDDLRSAAQNQQSYIR
jgi:hypothetical protein